MKKSCVVIGSGIAGIASAVRLAAKGHDVTVYEKNAYPGGKIKELRCEKGFRFDVGPSVFMLPYLVDELFTLCNKNPKDYFSYKPIETSFNYFYEDGTLLKGYANTEHFTRELVEKTGISEEVFHAYLKDIEAKFNITREVFIENSLHVFKNYFTRAMAYGIVNFGKIHAFKTMNELNKKYFKDERVVQLFNNYASYIGSNPFVAPATLNVIQHIEINTGVFMPEKGMYQIASSLVKLAEDMGVKFVYNTLVTEIVVENKKAIGIKIDKQFIAYDRVISNMDIYYTYKKLLSNQSYAKRVVEHEKSTSMICFYWGINKEFPELDIHNMLFTKNEKEEYDILFEKKTVSNDPTLYIFISSKQVKGDAPAGSENWFVMATAPNDKGQNWQEIVKETRKNTVAKINRMLKTDIEKHIVFEESLDPIKIQEDYLSAFGAVYGNNSDSKFSAFLRYPNFSRKIKNLYFVGGTVHPGAGIIMCLNSAKIMDKVFK